MDWDVIVLGAGAAGLFCAIEAGRRGRRVLVVDHAAKPGEKIRISGGGRCNFTNLSVGADRYLGRNPRFALSALRRFTPADFLARLEGAGIAWHEKTLGQLFCDGPATQVVDWLLRDLAAAGGVLWTGTSLGTVRRERAGFAVETTRGVQRAASVVVATGGKSIPKMGATGYGYQVAESFGLAVTETRPALVPLTFAEQELAWMRPLAGVAVQGRVSCGRQGFDEAVLFTHRGLSGPAVLQVSSYWSEGQEVALDLCPGQDAAAALRGAKASAGKGHIGGALARLVPERLARHLAEVSGVTGPLAEVPGAVLDRLAAGLHDWRLRPVGTEGYRTAEVTLGGVDTAGLEARTLEAKGVAGLFFVGEVVDVTGWLGGYNFQWAWSSGWAAGQVA